MEKQEVNQEELNIFQMYLDEIKEIRPCDECENEALVCQVLDGETDAKSRLIEGNLLAALSMTREYMNKGVQTGDLVQEANMALVMAVESLSVEVQKAGFEAYLKEQVKDALKAAVAEQDEEQKIEEKILARINVLDEVSKTMAQQLGREATVEELAERMQMSVDEVKEIMKQTLDAMSVTGEYEKSLEEMAADGDADVSEEERIAEKLLKEEAASPQPKIRRPGR